MIKRLYIDGYKSFKDCTINLKPLSIIFGPNGSGKSNLIDAVSFISALSQSKTIQDAFKEHRGYPLESFYYGEGGFEALMDKDSIILTIEVDVELSDITIEKVKKMILEKRKGLDEAKKKPIGFERHLRYKIVIEGFTKTGYLRVKEEKLYAIKEDGEINKRRKPFIETKERKVAVRMEGQGRPTNYDLGLDHTVVSEALYEPHYPHITAFKIESAGWRAYYLEPTMMRSAVAVQEARHISRNGDNLSAFLNVIQFENKKIFDNYVKTVKSVLPQ
ncbi:MAG: AAA family ATPase, partial [Calditrichota bacterium]